QSSTRLLSLRSSCFSSPPRLPLTSTLFPYTTLFRSNIVLDPGHGGYDPGSTALNGVFEKQLTMDMAKAIGNALEAKGATVLYTRSEEHTSELQSRFDLVCRLLLEKKKHITHVHPPLS